MAQILVIDDDPAMRETLCRVLCREGHSAVEAADGIHSDLARGFIRAETMTCADLFRLGSEREIKAAGLMRREPKDYVIQDGDAWIGQVIERDGPWSMCCFQEDTEDGCKEVIKDFIRTWAKRAGTIGNGWAIQWHHSWPEASERVYTR